MQPWVARWFLFGMGFQYIKVKGYLRSAAEVPILIVAPHSTILDTFFMSIFTLPSAVVKEEARHIPLFGSEFVVCVCVCVYVVCVYVVCVCVYVVCVCVYVCVCVCVVCACVRACVCVRMHAYVWVQVYSVCVHLCGSMRFVHVYLCVLPIC